MYEVLRGIKTPAKRAILSKCLILWITFKKVSIGPRKGALHEPSSTETYLKMMFGIFHLKGIEFKWDKDFNGTGEFGAVMTQLWRDQTNIEPTFGTGKNKATFDIDVDEKLRAHVSVCPIGTSEHGKTVFPFFSDGDRQEVLCHGFGRQMGLRGSAPLRNLVREKFFLESMKKEFI